MRLFQAFLLGLAATSISLADCRARPWVSGSYNRDESDLGEQDKVLSVRRHYDSSCKDKGVFGVGWGSQWETNLVIDGEYLLYREVGCGDVIPYKLVSSSDSFRKQHALGQSIANLIRDYKSSQEDFALEFQPVYNGQAIAASSPEEIFFRGETFTTSYHEFDRRGRLLRYLNYRITYSSDFMSGVTDVDTGDRIDFEMADSQSLMARLTLGGKNTFARYHFDVAGRLSSVSIGEDPIEAVSYEYEVGGTISAVIFADGKQEVVIYSSSFDNVQFVVNKDGCVDQYTRTPVVDQFFKSDLYRTCSGGMGTKHESALIKELRPSGTDLIVNFVYATYGGT